MVVLTLILLAIQTPTEADYYAALRVAVPKSVELEVGGMQPLKDGSLLVCTRRGEVWRISNPLEEAPQFSLWAHGLQEPLGLWQQGEWIYSATRGELLRMRDSNGDGRAMISKRSTMIGTSAATITSTILGRVQMPKAICG